MAATSLGIVDITALGAFVTDPGTGRLNVAPGWGIDTASHLPYYDPCGPQPGEEAWVRMDASGNLYLEQSATNGFGLEEGVRRPVEIREPAAPHALVGVTLGVGKITFTSFGGFTTEAGTGELVVAPGWGIRENGTAYFDPCGPTVGEAAWVRMDANGRLHLESVFNEDDGLVEGVARPVELLEPTVAPLVRKDGPAPTAPALRAVEIHHGRPVAQPAPQTSPIRRHWTEQHTKRTPAQAQHLRRQQRRQKNAQRIAQNVGGGTNG